MHRSTRSMVPFFALLGVIALLAASFAARGPATSHGNPAVTPTPTPWATYTNTGTPATATSTGTGTPPSATPTPDCSSVDVHPTTIWPPGAFIYVTVPQGWTWTWDPRTPLMQYNCYPNYPTGVNCYWLCSTIEPRIGSAVIHIYDQIGVERCSFWITGNQPSCPPTAIPTRTPIATSTPTATHTHTRTPTFTPTPGISPTGISQCHAQVTEATASCSLPENYTYHFHLTNICANGYFGMVELEAAPDIDGPWTVITQRYISRSYEPNIDGNFPETIPQQYDWYRLHLTGESGIWPFEATTDPAYICSRPTGTPTALPTSSATPTACAHTFQDVPTDNTFYPFVRCLACRALISGYPCGSTGEPCDPDNTPYFRPNNYVTRGQLAKVVSESAGFGEEIPPSQWTFTDVPYGSTFWVWVERLADREVMSGYPCGGPSEPCEEQNRPYFRSGNGATRGQLTKVVANAAAFSNAIPPGQYTFTDVPPTHTFWLFVERLLTNRPDVMAGYACGGPGEPCDTENRPYFRPNNPLTRGQTSKIVSNTFFPGCSPPGR